MGLRIFAILSAGGENIVLYEVMKPSIRKSPLAMLLRGGRKEGCVASFWSFGQIFSAMPSCY